MEICTAYWLLQSIVTMDGQSLTDQQHRTRARTLTESHSSKQRPGHDFFVLKRDELCLLCDRAGDINPEHGAALGLFYLDTRLLSRYMLRLNGELPIPLSAEHGGGTASRQCLENPDLHGTDSQPVKAHTIAIVRDRVAVEHEIRERIELTNFGCDAAALLLEIHYASDFADIYTIRGMANSSGRPLPPNVRQPDCVSLRFAGGDGAERSTTLHFSAAATSLDAAMARFSLQLAPQGHWHLEIILTPHAPPGDPSPRPAPAHGATRRDGERRDRTDVCGDPLLERVLRRGLDDLALLSSRRVNGLRYIAGGIPWFMTLFGRDSAIAALQTCGYHAGVTGDTLRVLASYQATHTDAFRDAQPGKILHELRRGALARMGVIPQSPAYYGSVDSTPLFIILLSEYLHWTGDMALARELRPHLSAALEWIETYGDSDGDGYLDYQGQYASGLVNQGWKDSGDAIVNADGSLVKPPVALCEVQGYTFRAWRSCARVLHWLGDGVAAARLEAKAAALQQRFERDFWSEKLGCYVLARHREGVAEVVASNAGQVLWSGLPTPERARRVAARLMEADMFSGWGIRTLSTRERRHNPLAYHLGSIWPHDNSLILSGLRHYGLDAAALKIFEGLFNAACGFRDHRLPELFCGFSRREHERHPVPYPVACSPQAWATGALPYATLSLLGLRPDATVGRLEVVAPCLPPSLTHLELRSLQVGDACVDLRFERVRDHVSVDATVRRGELEVRLRDEADSATHQLPMPTVAESP